MEFKLTSLEKRLKEDIKNYHIKNLFNMKALQEYLKCAATMGGLSLLLTERHGEKAIVIGDFIMDAPDVVKDPGRKVKVYGRTIGHLYTINNNDRPDKQENAEEFLDALVNQMSAHATAAYEHSVIALYADELEVLLENEKYQVKHGEKRDMLTGVLGKTYFLNRSKVIERSGVIPVALICININDWKYANQHFGECESDRLIQIIADILMKEAKPEYVIGRVDGDVFEVLIPMVLEDEEKEYCKRIQKCCDQYKDDKLAPSIACGYVIKTNVEQSLDELYSDAEYKMFENKLEVKRAPGYKERLEKIN